MDPGLDMTPYGINSGVIGILTIPKLELEMPLYLGANHDHLAAGAAVLGVYLCEVDCEGRGENKGRASVLQIFVPDRYQRMSKLKDFLSWADHVNGGKIVYCSSERMPEQMQWTEAVSEPHRQMEPAMIQRR